jgi:hypothetical protein
MVKDMLTYLKIIKLIKFWCIEVNNSNKKTLIQKCGFHVTI